MASLADLIGRPIEKTKQFALYDKLRRQHFGENDSTLASALMHPIEAAGRGAEWFQNQVNTAAGTGGDDYGGDPYLQRDQQAGAALNLAGLANMGAMPAAPRSAGGTLGTITGWHGSPYKFDNFDSSKIGTGEGAQAFGYGHYMTDSPEIADTYRKRISSLRSVPQEIPEHISKSLYAMDNLGFDNKRKAMAALRNDGVDYWQQHALPEDKPHLDAIRKYIDSTKDKGALYKIDANVEKEHLLEWDKPLSQQSNFIKSKLASTDSTGESFIRALEKTKGSQKDAAGLLKKMGIKGIMYKANGGKSSEYNYVIFNDNDMAIKENFSSLSSAIKDK